MRIWANPGFPDGPVKNVPRLDAGKPRFGFERPRSLGPSCQVGKPDATGCALARRAASAGREPPATPYAAPNEDIDSPFHMANNYLLPYRHTPIPGGIE